MAIYTLEMDISITEFKQRCLEIVRRVEKTGRPVTIRRIVLPLPSRLTRIARRVALGAS